MMPRPRTAPVALAGLLLLAAGCRDDEIRRYQVPRTPAPPARLLAAILPQPRQVWFVSVSGPAPAVGDLQPAFEQFVHSVRFPGPGDDPITWTAPDGWERTEDAPTEQRYATLRTGKDGLEVKVHSFGPESGDVLANVRRWAGQVGLKGVAEADLPKLTRTIDVNGVKATLVDLTGPADAERQNLLAEAAKNPNPQSAIRNPQSQAGKPLTYDVPAGWAELPASAFAVATFRVGDGGQAATVTVSPLTGDGGGLKANVDRWRGQIGLGPTTEEALKAESKSIDVDGRPAVYVDLAGPESAGAGRKRTLGVILPRGGQTWFFKMVGPAELVGQQQQAFERFVRSVRFGAAGGKS
jgi:hypothetical protein